MCKTCVRNIAFVIFLICLTSLVSAQFVDFGRNKVQYNDFEWRVMSTPHFKIYYYKNAREMAEHGAYFAEESYKILQQKFTHSLIDTVPIIFYSSPIHFKQTNTTPGLIPDGVGGFFEFIKGRVVIPFDGSLGNFKHVIRHELTHVFMTNKLSLQLKSHGTSTSRRPPLWFTEGLAEFFSTEWDTQADMFMCDAVLNDYIVGLDNWEKFYGTFYMYKLGQLVLEFISEKYGGQTVFEILENFWYNSNFSDVLEFTIGKSYSEFDEEFLPFIREKYFKDTLDYSKPSKVSKEIYTKSFAHKPVYTEINGIPKIYFIGNKYGYTSIFSINKNGNETEEVVLEGESSDEFESFHFFRTGLDISKDGKLAFVTQKGERDAIHIMDLNSHEVEIDYSFNSVVGIGTPTWSPDGKRLAFQVMEETGKNDIYILERESNSVTRLTNDFYDDRDPDFSPDGNYIVFSSDRTPFGNDNRYNLFLYDLRNDEILQLTNGDFTDYSPQFSPKGNKIVFTSDRGGKQNIWLIDLFPENGLKSERDLIRYDLLFTKGTEFITKRISRFVTAAYDPKWVEDDALVFSVFENASMNLRFIDSVEFRFENSTIEGNNDFHAKEVWEPGKITASKNISVQKYKKEFSLDIATTSLTTDPVFGSNAGGVLSMSDMLGNERYYFLVFNNSNTGDEFWKSFNIAISKFSAEERLNHAYGIYHLSGRRYDLRENDFSYYERMYGAYFAFSYPLSFFRRIQTSTSLSQSVKYLDITDYRRSLLLSNYISYVKDNSIWNYTGPIDGERLNVTLGYTTDIQNSNVNYYSILADYRRYIRLSKALTLAMRGQFFMNEGTNPRRFFLGGSWSLRGWPLNSIRGTKLWQSNIELRFPILEPTSFKTPMGFDFPVPPVRGAVFFDAGNVWDNSDNYGFTRGSIGAGLRFNLFGIVVLRYDLGKRIENNFSSFQGDIFHQVLFGWDF